RLSPINFAYFLERRRSEHAAEWRDSSSPYIAPELWDDNTWLTSNRELDREAEALSSGILPKAHQFALGMTAWMMVEGLPPNEVPKRRQELTKIRDFLDASRSFSARVKSAAWWCEARVLSSIIARMVEFEPANRWQDMKQVSRYLSAISAPDSTRKYLD